MMISASTGKDRGSALIIAMVILLVMTLIGITSMGTSIMEEKMAGSMASRNLAFQAAESALRQGEAWIAAQQYDELTNVSNDGSTSRIWNIKKADPDTTNNVAWWEETGDHDDPRDQDWWHGSNCDGSDAHAILNSGSDYIAGLAQRPGCSGATETLQPGYIIEELPPVPESLEVGKTVDDKDIYLQVTARGVGATPGAVVVLQSSYKW